MCGKYPATTWGLGGLATFGEEAASGNYFGKYNSPGAYEGKGRILDRGLFRLLWETVANRNSASSDR